MILCTIEHPGKIHKTQIKFSIGIGSIVYILFGKLRGSPFENNIKHWTIGKSQIFVLVELACVDIIC